MTYKTNTNMNADLAEAMVSTDLMRRGWIVLTPSSRDSAYDLVVEMHGTFYRVQVKKMSNHKLHRIVERGNQRVTKNGKVRNSIDYAACGVEWLAGVDIETKQIFYYPLDLYKSKPKSFSVKKHQPTYFPINETVRKNTDY
tara:strand:- start:196 stop:618 length:423 start_codon:yes stop_codon:yes gene_type:complete